MKLANVVLDINTLNIEEPFTYIVCDGAPDFDESSKIPASMYSQIIKTHNNLISKLDRDKTDINKYAIEVGSCVVAPFGNSLRIGFVVRVFDDSELDTSVEIKKLKPIACAVSRSFFDDGGSQFAIWMSKKYISPLSNCVRLLVPSGATPKLVHGKNGWYVKYAVADKPIRGKRNKNQKDKNDEPDGSTKNLAAYNYQKPDILTPDQQNAIDAIDAANKKADGSVVLLDGVTGSGKTEVYLRAIEDVIHKNKTAIVMVPEISLTPQTVSRFVDRLGEVVAVVHSKMTPRDKYEQWRRMKEGEARVVVGPRSAIFSPLKNIGIIVLDEEHDSSYKQESSPRYVTRACAQWLARRHCATVVLGSATPSIESLYACEKQDGWTRVSMPVRANGARMPKIEVVDMAAEFNSGQKSMFSARLSRAIVEEVKAGHKVILLHNRRGFANYMFCRDCGYIPTCNNCSVSFTYHERRGMRGNAQSSAISGSGPMLVCHHCGAMQNVDAKCPKCGSVYFAKLGAGTQSVENQLEELLRESDIECNFAEDSDSSEGVSIVRMDSDTTKTRGGHQTCLDQFVRPGAAILLGTQMIAKGLDFSDVTLVGVVLADTTLNFPDFRANERAFQLISQVAGRAGRGNLEGRVIVQTYAPENIALQAAANYNRVAFLKDELPKRKVLFLSPYCNMVNVLLWGPVECDVKAASELMHQIIVDYRRNVTGDNWEIGDSLACSLGRLRGNYRYHILVKCNKMMNISDYLYDCVQIFKASNKNKDIRLACDVDPYSLV